MDHVFNYIRDEMRICKKFKKKIYSQNRLVGSIFTLSYSRLCPIISFTSCFEFKEIKVFCTTTNATFNLTYPCRRLAYFNFNIYP